LYLPVRRHGGDATRRSWRRHSGQDQLRRVRHGLVEREFWLLPGAQSARPLARAWRLFGWIGCSGRCRNRGGFDWFRHWRLDSAAGGILRRRRAKAHLWTSIALRAYRLRFIARSRWAVWQERQRYGFDVAVHGRPRATRFDVRRRPRTQLSRPDWPAGARLANRSAGRIFRRGTRSG